MSQWTHPICDDCWEAKYPEREPHRIREEYRDPERCCYCGKDQFDGIYIRDDPATVANHVQHPESE